MNAKAESHPLKSFASLVRRPDLTRRQFLEHWSGRHAELALAVEDYATFRAGYVQNHVVDQQPPAVLGPVAGPGLSVPDGLAEVWLQPGVVQDGSFERSHSYASTVLPDEPAFLDLDASVGFQAREHVILDGRGDGKVVTLVRRSPAADSAPDEGWGPQPFVDDAARRRLIPPVTGHVWNAIIPETARSRNGQPVAREQQIAGIVETWFASIEHAAAALEFFNQPGGPGVASGRRTVTSSFIVNELHMFP